MKLKPKLCIFGLRLSERVLLSVQCLRKEPVQKEKKMKMKKKKKSRRKACSSDDDDEERSDDEQSSSTSSSSSDEESEMVHRQRKSAVSVSDSDMEDEDAVFDRLPENSNHLLDFASASQGILQLLVLKQHLKNLYGFSDR